MTTADHFYTICSSDLDPNSYAFVGRRNKEGDPNWSIEAEYGPAGVKIRLTELLPLGVFDGHQASRVVSWEEMEANQGARGFISRMVWSLVPESVRSKFEGVSVQRPFSKPALG